MILYHGKDVQLTTNNGRNSDIWKIGEVFDILQDRFGSGCYADKFYALSIDSYGVRVMRADATPIHWTSKIGRG